MTVIARCVVLLLILLALHPTAAQTAVELWVDPDGGDDNKDGATRDTALLTLREAWNRIPMGEPLDTAYTIHLLPGVYSPDDAPGYWESRYGSEAAPIVLRAEDGRGTVMLPPINMFDTRYLSLIDISVEGEGGIVFHCERCDHIYVTGATITGLGDMDADAYEAPLETVKFNQSQYIYFEDNDISHAQENAVDFVAVQYGHFLHNRIHDAGDWCMYLKGGSAHFLLEDNEIYDCWTGGFTAGQGTGLEFMVSPWLHYEAYDIRFVNNVVHDTFGAGMGVNGGYNILLAHNTLYRVGARSHVLEIVFGLRSCDGDTEACAARLAEGGWGVTETGIEQPIPNRNVFVYNNLIVNPPNYQSEWQHFTIDPPRPSLPDSNVPDPVTTDNNVQIRGNVILNGDADMWLGVEDGMQGCAPANPTCNETQLRADNAINTFVINLSDPDNGDYRPVPETLSGAVTFPIPDFSWDDAPTTPAVPTGELDNRVLTDAAGEQRGETPTVGAYEAE